MITACQQAVPKPDYEQLTPPERSYSAAAAPATETIEPEPYLDEDGVWWAPAATKVLDCTTDDDGVIWCPVGISRTSQPNKYEVNCSIFDPEFTGNADDLGDTTITVSASSVAHARYNARLEGQATCGLPPNRSFEENGVHYRPSSTYRKGCYVYGKDDYACPVGISKIEDNYWQVDYAVLLSTFSDMENEGFIVYATSIQDAVKNAKKLGDLCYTGSGQGLDAYEVMDRNLCPDNRRYRFPKIFEGSAVTLSSSSPSVAQESTTETNYPYIVAASVAEQSWVTSSHVVVADAPFIFECKDAEDSTVELSLVIYGADATRGNHRYYGKATRAGFCESERILEYRYPTDNKTGTAKGERPLHENLAVLEIDRDALLDYMAEWIVQNAIEELGIEGEIDGLTETILLGLAKGMAASSVVLNSNVITAMGRVSIVAANKAVECLERDAYVAAKDSGEQLTNARNPDCFDRDRKGYPYTNVEDSCPGVDVERKAGNSGKCYCPDGKTDPIHPTWECPATSKTKRDTCVESGGSWVQFTCSCPGTKTLNRSTGRCEENPEKIACIGIDGASWFGGTCDCPGVNVWRAANGSLALAMSARGLMVPVTV